MLRRIRKGTAGLVFQGKSQKRERERFRIFREFRRPLCLLCCIFCEQMSAFVVLQPCPHFTIHYLPICKCHFLRFSPLHIFFSSATEVYVVRIFSNKGIFLSCSTIFQRDLFRTKSRHASERLECDQMNNRIGKKKEREMDAQFLIILRWGGQMREGPNLLSCWTHEFQ